MIPSRVEETLPELAPFVHAVQARRPDDGTWCEAWTVRDVLVHQTGNAEELARVLQAFLDGAPVETRGFDREEPYRRLSDTELWAAFLNRCEKLSEVAAAAAQDLSPDTEMMWTGRLVKAPFFAEHMREELILHRWDLTGDDRTAVQSLTEPWMTEHSVVSVGRPLLEKGRVGLDLGPEGRIAERSTILTASGTVVTWPSSNRWTKPSAIKRSMHSSGSAAESRPNAAMNIRTIVLVTDLKSKRAGPASQSPGGRTHSRPSLPGRGWHVTRSRG
ncbi:MULTISPECIES: maleylpyruvate isomerase N-terminal domain-containing protein [unclassified Streptomyces]|uniref:maleylpyruvate isomerase N-terminal domain-containing protein n=1 Tax=unclassified Streptomyces TaxID=2593676 RepID=UPI00343D63B6